MACMCGVETQLCDVYVHAKAGTYFVDVPEHVCKRTDALGHVS